jgi:hypothetical protein
LGYTLCTNGFSNKVHNRIALFCSQFCKARLSTAHEPSDYRITYIRSNKLAGSRGIAGQRMSRR